MHIKQRNLLNHVIQSTSTVRDVQNKTYIYVCVYISSSSYRAISTDIPDLLSPLLPIVHLFRQVLRAAVYVRAVHPAFARPCERVHKNTSLMSSSLLLQQCPACLVRLILIVFVIGGRWPYSCCFVGCFLQHSCVVAIISLYMLR